MLERDNAFVGYYYSIMVLRGKQSGFTFLEVMIAVAVIAISFVTLIGSQSQSVAIGTDARQRLMASFLAQQKLAELEAAGFDEIYSSEGDFDEDFPSFHWKTEISSVSGDELGIEGADDMLKTIELTLTLGDDTVPVFTVRSMVMKKIEPVKK